LHQRGRSTWASIWVQEVTGDENSNTYLDYHLLSLPAKSARQLQSLRGNAIMKTTKIAVLVLTIAVALFILIPSLSWAEDGAALYKAKCAMCHGADATGKPAAKIPSLISPEVKAKSDADLTKAVAETAKHPAPVKGLAADDVKAVVTYIRSLQK
jgi:mono/diheme cytochrome c family protein